MIRQQQHSILPGREFEGLIGPSRGNTIVVSRGATVQDTIRTIEKVVVKYGHQVRRLAPQLQAATLLETCENLWNWTTTFFRYREDEQGVEQVRTPARAFADRLSGIDCDCFSTLLSAMLNHLKNPETDRIGIPHVLRVTKYPDPKKKARTGHTFTSWFSPRPEKSPLTRFTTALTRKYLTWTNMTTQWNYKY